MRRGLLFSQHTGGFVFKFCLLFLLGVGITGCGVASQASPAKPIVCTPQAVNVNIYRMASASSAGVPNVPPSGTVTNITQEQAMALLQGTPLQGLPQAAVPSNGYTALAALVNETKSWSDVQTIELDEMNKAQVVVTFLSPPLIKAVYDSETAMYGSMNYSLQAAMDHIAKREELLFFVSVITNTNNNVNTTLHTIDIPIPQMTIVNADDLYVSPLHDDHNLDQPIISSHEPVFGYLSYPIAMQNGTQCTQVLNPDYNKRIVIVVPSISVDKKENGPYSWIIPYSSLFKIGAASTSQTTIAIETDQVLLSLTPPSLMKDLLTPEGMEESTFWQIYSGFLWRQVMQGIY